MSYGIEIYTGLQAFNNYVIGASAFFIDSFTVSGGNTPTKYYQNCPYKVQCFVSLLGGPFTHDSYNIARTDTMPARFPIPLISYNNGGENGDRYPQVTFDWRGSTSYPEYTFQVVVVTTGEVA